MGGKRDHSSELVHLKGNVASICTRRGEGDTCTRKRARRSGEGIRVRIEQRANRHVRLRARSTQGYLGHVSVNGVVRIRLCL